MKRTFLTGAALVLIAALALAACNKGGSSGSANAQSGGRSVTLAETDFQYAMTKDGSGVKLLAYLGDKGDNLIIPDTFEGFSVVAIGDIDDLDGNKMPVGKFKGFEERSDADMKKAAESDNAQTKENSIFVNTSTKRKNRITSIKIPDTVTYIGQGAFLGLTNVTTITLPKSLKIIGGGNYVFAGSGITSITIPDGVIIGFRAFNSCRSLTTVTIGENVQIDRYAFANNPELATVNIPSSVKFTNQGDFTAFDKCPKLNIAMQNAIKATGYTGSF